MKNKIIIAAEHKAKMAKEFNTSKQTIMMALKGFNESELASKIRARAKALLFEESEKAIV